MTEIIPFDLLSQLLDLIASDNTPADMLKSVYDTGGSSGSSAVDLADGILGGSSSGNSKYYGTSPTGVLGFNSLPTVGHAIKEEGGAALTQRANLNFIGTAVTATDNAGTAATDVTIKGIATDPIWTAAEQVVMATGAGAASAIAVAVQTVVGRITAGSVKALSVAELITLVLSAALPENTAIILDPNLSADGKYSGIVEAGTAGAALAFGDLVYYAATAKWLLANATATGVASANRLGICVLAAAGDASVTTVLLWGKVRADAVFPNLTIGSPVFMSTTAGDVVVAVPVAAGNIMRIVGHGGITLNELDFHPSPDYFEHV